MKVEICANSFQSAVNAEQGGAHRIELCSELAVGGVTPSYGMICKTKETLSIPVFVLIRPRSGNFTYSKDEFDCMLKDILLCKELGCEGIVSGVLRKNGHIDLERTQLLVEAAGDLEFTFHRAFDWVINPLEAIHQLASIGVSRVLTSGLEKSAVEGLGGLLHLKAEAAGKIAILPGGGINPANAGLFKEAGFKEIHASLTEQELANDSPKVPMNSLKHFSETHLATTSLRKTELLIQLLNNEK